jgi:hypothetical protein
MATMDGIAFGAFGTDSEARWRWPGGVGSVLQAVGKPVYCARVGPIPAAPAIPGALLLFLKTGKAVGGAATPGNPFRWKPGGLLHLSQAGGANNLMNCPSLPEIRGVVSPARTLVLTCHGVQGYVDPLLYTFLGFADPNNTIQTVAGAFSVILQGAPTFASGGRGRYACASVMLTPAALP